MPSMVSTTALILAQARKGKNAEAEALLLRQLAQTTLLIGKAAKASGDARVAQQTATMMRQRLTVVRDSYAAQIDQNAIDALPPHLRFMRQRNELHYGKGSSASAKSPIVDVPTTRRPATPQRDGHER
jgi:hypothetical protein